MTVDVLAALPRLAQRLGGEDAVLAAAERLSERRHAWRPGRLRWRRRRASAAT